MSNKRIKELEQRVEKLEKMVESLQKSLTNHLYPIASRQMIEQPRGLNLD